MWLKLDRFLDHCIHTIQGISKFWCKIHRLLLSVDLLDRDIFIGEVIETYLGQECITDGKLDFKKINPLLFTLANAKYWELGNIIGSTYNEGKTIQTMNFTTLITLYISLNIQFITKVVIEGI